jgi:hypothetical protein
LIVQGLIRGVVPFPPPDSSPAAIAQATVVAGLAASAAALPIICLATAILTAAQCRAVLRPSARQAGFVRLGGDEFRMAVLVIILFAVVGLLALVIASFAAFIVGFLATRGPARASRIYIYAVGVPAWLVTVFLLARLSLASSLTLETDRVDVFGSWRMTRGSPRVVLVCLIAGLVWTGLYFAANWIARLPPPAYTVNGGLDFAVLIGPKTVAALACASLLGTIGKVLATCPGPDLYRQVVGGVEDVF